MMALPSAGTGEGRAFLRDQYVARELILLPAQIFVALFYLRRRLRLQAAKDLQQPGRIKRFELIVCFRAAGEAWGCDHDDRHLWLKPLDLSSYIRTGHVVQPSVEHDAANGRKRVEDLQCLFAAVGGEDVELGGFDHKFAGRDTARELAVDHKKAWPVHAEH